MRTVRVAADDAERALLWKGRKSAFGAIARIKPNYYLHDTVVPRAQLPAVLAKVYEIVARHDLLVLNVFHAGDGNLHPLLVYDGREPGIIERVHAAGDEIVRVSVEAGGVLSGEHGIGLEKRDLMPLMFSAVDLAAQAALRDAFDPQGLANPGKVLPSPAGCGDLHVAGAVAGARGSDRLRRRCRRRRRGHDLRARGRGAGRSSACARCGPPAGIDWIQPAEMTVSCGAGHGRRRARRRPRRARPAGRPAAGRDGRRRAGRRPQRHPPPRRRPGP